MFLMVSNEHMANRKDKRMPCTRNITSLMCACHVCQSASHRSSSRDRRLLGSRLLRAAQLKDPITTNTGICYFVTCLCIVLEGQLRSNSGAAPSRGWARSMGYSMPQLTIGENSQTAWKLQSTHLTQSRSPLLICTRLFPSSRTLMNVGLLWV